TSAGGHFGRRMCPNCRPVRLSPGAMSAHPVRSRRGSARQSAELCGAGLIESVETIGSGCGGSNQPHSGAVLRLLALRLLRYSSKRHFCPYFCPSFGRRTTTLSGHRNARAEDTHGDEHAANPTLNWAGPRGRLPMARPVPEMSVAKRHTMTKWPHHPNLRKKPHAPSKGRGPVQRAIRRAFMACAAEVLNSTEIYDWAHGRRRFGRR